MLQLRIDAIRMDLDFREQEARRHWLLSSTRDAVSYRDLVLAVKCAVISWNAFDASRDLSGLNTLASLSVRADHVV